VARTLIPLLTLAFGAAAACARGEDPAYRVESGGRTRTYLLHVPSAKPIGPRPLVVLLHGRLGNGQGMARMTSFDRAADRAGVLVAYPDGFRRSWADGRGGTPADDAGVDDVAFFDALLRDVESRFAVDPGRVFVAGMSNGGFMSERLACEAADRIAAIGVVAATFSEALAERCRPSRPVSVVLMNGTDDPLVPFAGGELSRDRGLVKSAAETAALWRRLDGCSGKPLTTRRPDTAGDGTSVTEETDAACAEGAGVTALRIEGGGHTWPSGQQYLPVSVVGRASKNLDANQALLDFFAAHHR
jgi:polyhydroxybutyrate depolymerase